MARTLCGLRAQGSVGDTGSLLAIWLTRDIRRGTGTLRSAGWRRRGKRKDSGALRWQASARNGPVGFSPGGTETWEDVVRAPSSDELQVRRGFAQAELGFSRYTVIADLRPAVFPGDNRSGFFFEEGKKSGNGPPGRGGASRFGGEGLAPAGRLLFSWGRSVELFVQNHQPAAAPGAATLPFRGNDRVSEITIGNDFTKGRCSEGSKIPIGLPISTLGVSLYRQKIRYKWPGLFGHPIARVIGVTHPSLQILTKTLSRRAVSRGWFVRGAKSNRLDGFEG